MENNQNSGVCILGLGYVGLTLAVSLASLNFKVYGIEPADNILRALKLRKSIFYEEGMESFLEKYTENNFFFQKEIKESLASCYIIAVGTPINKRNKPIFAPLKSCCCSLGKVLKKNDLVILRSTVAVGTSRSMVIPLLEKKSCLKAGVDFDFVFAPERTVEGGALKELFTLPQIIGGINQKSASRAQEFFRKLTPDVVLVNSLESAEFTKVTANTFRDLNFAFANVISLACNQYNLDPQEIIKAANFKYNRSNIPVPSPGVGGYCLTKDPYIFSRSFNDLGLAAELVRVGRKVNVSMVNHVAGIIDEFFKTKSKNMIGANISILGLAFKGNPPTSDIRFSPSLDVINLLRERKVNITVHDFVVLRETIKDLDVAFAEKLEDTFIGSDAVVVMNNHCGYRCEEIAGFLAHMNRPALFFDPWQLHDPLKILKAGNVYYSNLGYSSFRE